MLLPPLKLKQLHHKIYPLSRYFGRTINPDTARHPIIRQGTAQYCGRIPGRAGTKTGPRAVRQCQDTSNSQFYCTQARRQARIASYSPDMAPALLSRTAPPGSRKRLRAESPHQDGGSGDEVIKQGRRGRGSPGRRKTTGPDKRGPVQAPAQRAPAQDAEPHRPALPRFPSVFPIAPATPRPGPARTRGGAEGRHIIYRQHIIHIS